MRTCTVEVNGVRCERPHRSKGRCLLHWKRQRLGIPDDKPIREVSRWTGKPQRGALCNVNACGLKVRSAGLCTRHYRRKKEDPGNWSGPLMPHPASVGLVELRATAILPLHQQVLEEEMARRGLKHRSFLVREALTLWTERVLEERRQEALAASLYGKWRRGA